MLVVWEHAQPCSSSFVNRKMNSHFMTLQWVLLCHLVTQWNYFMIHFGFQTWTYPNESVLMISLSTSITKNLNMCVHLFPSSCCLCVSSYTEHPAWWRFGWLPHHSCTWPCKLQHLSSSHSWSPVSCHPASCSADPSLYKSTEHTHRTHTHTCKLMVN